MINNKKPVNVYVILGEANMRKSSTMRCLSGIDRKNVYEIQHINGSIRDTFVRISSLQEADCTEFEFVTYVTKEVKKHYDDIFISLRIKGFIHPKSKRPLNSAQDYINHFVSIGWTVIKIVDFQDSKNIVSLGNITPTLTLIDTDKKTSNYTASIVRNHFNWI
ncbi:hypothetical protein [Clostridium sp. 'White wine YQ']|uniref:hypothetical protein n=1 Tax=Clostridium sp. 'White wine YQ' TaxID=3027474 RepID=UPI002366ED60|nr:hypothetical protein [Clostridium sp. 'White wine YQ']MDD7793830.1 hypothetical protein [Clostridium sp. 'White wine YQ']